MGQIFLYIMLVIALTVLAVTVAVDRSRLGFGFRCIHQNEDGGFIIIGFTREESYNNYDVYLVRIAPDDDELVAGGSFGDIQSRGLVTPK